MKWRVVSLVFFAFFVLCDRGKCTIIGSSAVFVAKIEMNGRILSRVTIVNQEGILNRDISPYWENETYIPSLLCYFKAFVNHSYFRDRKIIKPGMHLYEDWQADDAPPWDERSSYIFYTEYNNIARILGGFRNARPGERAESRLLHLEQRLDVRLPREAPVRLTPVGRLSANSSETLEVWSAGFSEFKNFIVKKPMELVPSLFAWFKISGLGKATFKRVELQPGQWRYLRPKSFVLEAIAHTAHDYYVPVWGFRIMEPSEFLPPPGQTCLSEKTLEKLAETPVLEMSYEKFMDLEVPRRKITRRAGREAVQRESTTFLWQPVSVPEVPCDLFLRSYQIPFFEILED